MKEAKTSTLFISEAPKNGNYVKAIRMQSSYDDGQSFPIGEVVIANEPFNFSAEQSDDLGGFNVATEESVLRWILRGDTLCDVTIPKDARIYKTRNPNTPGGTFVADKIILSNPRIYTDDLMMELYRKSNVPFKTYIQIVKILISRNFPQTCKTIIEEKVNAENANEALEVFESYFGTGTSDLYKEMHNKIKEKANDNGKR